MKDRTSVLKAKTDLVTLERRLPLLSIESFPGFWIESGDVPNAWVRENNISGRIGAFQGDSEGFESLVSNSAETSFLFLFVFLRLLQEGMLQEDRPTPSLTRTLLQQEFQE